jgi:hypothetical protein
MHNAPMTVEEFEKLLDIHGASLQRWPAAAATRGRELLAASARARAVHAQAENLEHELDLALTAESLTTGALRARILDEVARTTAARWGLQRLFGGAGWVRPMVMALIPLCLGFAIGVGYPESNGVSDDLVTDVSLFSFAAYEDDPDAQ